MMDLIKSLTLATYQYNISLLFQSEFFFHSSKAEIKMRAVKISLVIILSLISLASARSISLSQKELKSFGDVLRSVLDHHLNEKTYSLSGTFNFQENEENPDDYDVSVDIDINQSETHNGVLSGNTFL